MRKNIIIQEGGVARQFGSVSKLQTALMGGGSCLWVPEDEVQVKTKHITKNGTYAAASDGVYGFSEVTVNVSGGSGSADSSGHPTGGDIAPGGSGSAVVGTDPETGNDLVVGVDEIGNLVKTPVPSAIKIIKAPNKTEYTEREHIDYTGMIVHLLNKNGSTFTSARYPGGTVPFNQLIFPVEKAETGGDGKTTIPSYNSRDGWPNQLKVLPTPQTLMRFSPGTYHAEFWAYGSNHYVNLELESAAYLGINGGGSRLCIVSDGVINYNDNRYAQRSSVTTLEINGQTYHGLCKYDANWGMVNFLANVPTISGWSSAHQEEGLDDLLCMVYGNSDAHHSTSVPVQWKSTYDGRQMEDTFEITVTPAEESGGTNVDEGGFSGGGGTF